jgi:hypothetical protein
MKNQFIVTLLIFCMSTTVAMAQTKKPTTTTKKPTTTVKSSAPKTTTTTKKTTTTTTTTPVVTPPVVEQKTTTTTTTTTPTQGTTTPATTTTIQSSGPSKGKKTSEPKPEKVREPKPEKVRTPRESSGSYSGGVKFGIRAEASQVVTFEEGASLAFSPGVNAGLIVNIPFSEKVSIQPEVLFSMQTVKITDTGTPDYLKVTGNSILAPVTLNLNLGHSSTKFMINLGGYAEYALSASSEQSIGGVKTSKTVDLSGTDKFSYGAVVGLGVKLNNSFLIEARSFYDLKESNNKTIVATLGIGYLF